MGDCLADPFDEGLAEECWGDEAPVSPRLVSAALDDGGDAGAFLDGSGVGETVSVLAEGGEKPGRQSGASTVAAAERLVGREAI